MTNEENVERFRCYFAMWIVTSSVYMCSAIVMFPNNMVLQWIIFVCIPFIWLWHKGFD